MEGKKIYHSRSLIAEEKCRVCELTVLRRNYQTHLKNGGGGGDCDPIWQASGISLDCQTGGEEEASFHCKILVMFYILTNDYCSDLQAEDCSWQENGSETDTAPSCGVPSMENWFSQVIFLKLNKSCCEYRVIIIIGVVSYISLTFPFLSWFSYLFWKVFLA